MADMPTSRLPGPDANREGTQVELHHTYRLGRRLHATPIYEFVEAQWLPFGRSVQIRSYAGLKSSTLRMMDRTRIATTIQRTTPNIVGPGVPDIIDTGLWEEMSHFLVMRLPPGDLMSSMLARGHRFAPEEVAELIADLAAALDTYRSTAGEPHRGPTAERIWVTQEGRAILLGYGEVLYREDSLNAGGPPVAEFISHLPPEVFAFSASSSVANEEDEGAPTSGRFRTAQLPPDAVNCERAPAAEVYALGCLAYQAFSGHHPYFVKANDATEGIRATLAAMPAPLKRLPAGSVFETTILQAMSRQSSDRQATTGDFASALQAAFDDGSSDALPQLRSTAVAQASSDDLRSLSLWRMTGLVSLAMLIVLFAYLQFRPYSVVVTSDPPSLDLVEVVGHTAEPLGRTPLVLERRSLSTPIQLRVMGKDGKAGPVTTHDPKEFQDLGNCRRLAVQLKFDER